MGSSKPLHRFNATQLKGEDGRMRAAFRIACSCGQTETYRGNLPGTGTVDEMLIKRFRRSGWYIGPNTERCPKCTSREAHAKPEKEKPEMPHGDRQPDATVSKEFKVMDKMGRVTQVLDGFGNVVHAGITPAGDPPSGGSGRKLPPAQEIELTVKPPRDITPDARRRIFREIDDHWTEASRSYEHDWSDRRIATALDVPRAWVALVRDESFGGPDNKEQVAELIQALGDKIALSKNLSDQAMKLATDFEALQGDFATLLKRVEAMK